MGIKSRRKILVVRVRLAEDSAHIRWVFCWFVGFLMVRVFCWFGFDSKIVLRILKSSLEFLRIILKTILEFLKDGLGVKRCGSFSGHKNTFQKMEKGNPRNFRDDTMIRIYSLGCSGITLEFLSSPTTIRWARMMDHS